LSAYDAEVLVAERPVADYFEAVIASSGALPKMVANWITGDLFSLLNQAGDDLASPRLSPQALGELIQLVADGEINQNTAKSVLAEMYHSGKSASGIVSERGLLQVSDANLIAAWVSQALDENPGQVQAYLSGKESVSRWLFGQVMRQAKGQANPQVLQQELDRQLAQRRNQ